MTISSQICKRTYQADGENRRWAVDFPYLSASELKVYCTDSLGAETDISAQCVLDEIEHEIIYPTVDSEQEPLAAGYKITILRNTTPTQTLHLTQQGTLDAAALEQGFDKLTLHVQELAEQIKRSIKYPVSSTKTDADAQTFLTELQTTQTSALNSALASVSSTATSLEQLVEEEATARVQADTNLLTVINSKQNTLSADQQYAVNSGISAAKVSSYDTHLLSTNNPHTVTKAQVGLGNVDNTADVDKPISSAVQSALNGKQDMLTTAQQEAVNSGVTASTVAQVEANEEDIAALDAELDENREWQKPSDWVDIRSGACPNSVYYLVGHSADYSTYPQFSVYATIQNSGTYDVFVDGVKQATTASGTETVLTWQTLALKTGYDTTYPSALKTHIVRVTPSISTNKIAGVRLNQTPGNSELVHGVLWAHFSLDYSTDIQRFAGSAYKSIAPVLEVVTAENNLLKVSACNTAFRKSGLKHLAAILDYSNSSGSTNELFFDCASLQGVVTLKNLSTTLPIGYYNRMFQNATSLKKIIFDGGCVQNLFYVFDNCTSLKEIRGMIPNNTSGLEQIYWTKNYAYENPTLLDLSPNSICIKCDLQQNPWLKGLTVSNEAPFTGASPQLNVSYTGLDRAALVNLFNSLPTVSASQVCNVTGATGASDLTASDLAIATGKGWTITR